MLNELIQKSSTFLMSLNELRRDVFHRYCIVMRLVMMMMMTAMKVLQYNFFLKITDLTRLGLELVRLTHIWLAER